MECPGHMFKYKPRYTVRSGRFVARSAAQGLLHDGGSDAPGNHRCRGSWRWMDMSDPGKGGPRGERGVRRESGRFQLCEFGDDLSGEVSCRPVVSPRMMKRSVGRKGVFVAPYAVRRIDLRATLRFLNKHAESGLSAARSPLIASVAHE